MIFKNNPFGVFIRNNKVFLIITFLAGIIGSICTIFLSLSIGSFYHIIFHSSGNKSRLLSLLGFHDAKNIHYFFIFYVGLLLIKSIADWFFYYLSKVSSNRLSRLLRDNLFEHQLNTRYDLFSKKSPAKYLLRYSGDLQAIQNLYIQGFLILFKDLALLFIGFYFLLKINIVLALIYLAALPLLFFINYLFNIPLQKLIKEKRDRKSDLLSFVSHCFHAITSVKAFRKEKIEVSRFKKKSGKLYNSSVNYFFQFAFVQSLAPVLLYFVIGIVLFMVAAGQVIIGYGDLMAFVLIGMLQLSAMKRVVKVETIWRTGNISLQKINMLLSEPREPGNPDLASKPFHSLEFKNLSLNEPILNEPFIKNHITRGDINYISGMNSEKLIRILVGVETNDNDEILLNNLSIGKFTTAELRNTFSVSSDYLPLYGSDLYEIIAPSKKPGRKEIIEDILHEIGWDFINFPLTQSATFEKSRILFTIQERKLISLARALLVNNPVLILDNPFDGLTDKIAFKCTNYLKSLLPGKTIIILSSYYYPNKSGIKLSTLLPN